MYYVYVFMQRRMQNSHVIITQLRELVVPPLPGAPGLPHVILKPRPSPECFPPTHN